jgi:hypothetical protein
VFAVCRSTYKKQHQLVSWLFCGLFFVSVNSAAGIAVTVVTRLWVGWLGFDSR